jgi:UDP-glucose 4-epimerase
VNIRGTFNVLEACVKHQVKRLVYSSSASVYGDALEIPMTEDHPFNNKTFYGATKIAGEQMCRAFHHRYGLNYVGLRYMNVYGPRQDYKGAYIAVIMKILDRLDQGLPPVVYGETGLKPMISSMYRTVPERISAPRRPILSTPSTTSAGVFKPQSTSLRN